ncbi:MAG TPA: class F sortase [Kineosporiaceae bacterium]|nr:class F sortase [Kineosporiaceae bacterium]
MHRAQRLAHLAVRHAGWFGVGVALVVLLTAALAERQHRDHVTRAAAGTAHLGVGYRFPHDGWMGTYSVNDRPTFCIDLNGRGPSTASGYTVGPAEHVKKQVGWSPDHTGGDADALTGPELTASELAQLAYVTDAYAATDSKVTAAAAEHVVRLLTVGDTAQVNREKARWAQTLAAYPKVKAAYAAMSQDVRDHAGPYTLTATWATKPTATAEGTLVTSLTSAAGRPMPKVALAVTLAGAPLQKATTDAKGAAKLTVTAVAKGDLTVTVTAKDLPATVPLLYTPARYTDARSPDHAAQRTVGAAPRTTLAATATATITPIVPAIGIKAQPKAPAVGVDLTVDVTVAKALPGWTGTVTVALWGPFPAKPKATDCTDPATPATTTTVDVTTDDKGAATASTPAATADAPGWYAWVATLPGTPLQDDAVTPCASASATFVVSASPALALAVDGDRRPGASLDVRLTLSGSMPGTPTKAALTMFGPFADQPDDTSCTPKSKATTATAAFTGDDTVSAATVVPTLAGYYTWTASTPGTPAQAAASVPCGDPGGTFALARDDLGQLVVTNTSTAGALTGKPPAGIKASLKIGSKTVPLVTMPLQGGSPGTPDLVSIAGELDAGAHAGDRWGTIVVAGRVGDTQGVPGAIVPLTALSPGDVITLTDTNARSQKFTVDTVTTQPRIVPLPPDLFVQGQTPLRLVVLTATTPTTFGAGLITHLDHLIVTASPA